MASDPSAPLVTWRSAQGRIELSRRTYGAAVVKAANLLGEELGVEPGVTVRVDLGSHWQSCVWLSAILVCGGTVVERDADVDIVAPEAVLASPQAAQTVIVGLDPFGMPPRDVPPGTVNGCADVRGMPDALVIAPADGVPVSLLAGAALDLASWELKAASVSPGPVALVGAGSASERLLWHAVVPALTGTAVVLGTDVGEDAQRQERVGSVVTMVG